MEALWVKVGVSLIFAIAIGVIMYVAIKGKNK